ncbi:cytochrome P450 [Photorhabdus tasmaniensis]|uniref:cytochrome P450 n=1 Tax=Photorhabdus sp. RM323S TaxID=3342828 RepID=UPI0036DBE1ED
MRYQEIKKIKGLPLIGSILDYKSDALSLFLKAARENGDISIIKMGPESIVFVNNPDWVAEILAKKMNFFVKSPSYRELELLLGQGMVTTEGDVWKKQRDNARHAFHITSLNSLIAPVKDIITQFSYHTVLDGHQRDIFKDMLDLSMSIALKTLFGQSSIDTSRHNVSIALERASDYVIKRLEAIIKLPPQIPTISSLKFRKEKSVLDRKIAEIIKNNASEGHQDCLLNMIIENENDHDAIKNQLLTLFLTSYETIASAATWTFYFISRYKRWYKIIKDEYTSAVLENASDIFELKYTNAVINESMRLLPPVWSFSRTAKEDVSIGEYKIAAGTMVVVSPYCLQRHPDYWDKADDFIPERWLGEINSHKLNRTFIPFGAGPRICLGINYARMVLPIIIGEFCKKGFFETNYQEYPELKAGITIRPVNGVNGVWRESPDDKGV